MPQRHIEKHGPDPVDIHVGSKVRATRTLMGMSQEKLGDALGLTFQQVQKYERGANRMGASRLHQISKILQVPVEYFFEDLPGNSSTPGPVKEALHKREILELVRSFDRIPEGRTRKRVFELVKAMARDANPEAKAAKRG